MLLVVYTAYSPHTVVVGLGIPTLYAPGTANAVVTSTGQDIETLTSLIISNDPRGDSVK